MNTVPSGRVDFCINGALLVGGTVTTGIARPLVPVSEGSFFAVLVLLRLGTAAVVVTGIPPVMVTLVVVSAAVVVDASSDLDDVVSPPKVGSAAVVVVAVVAAAVVWAVVPS